MPELRGLAAVAGVLALSATLARAHDEDPPEAEAPPLLYELPAAGSYALPVIDRVADHRLVGADGAPAPLLELDAGQLAFVSFVYLSCSDAAGCPLALASLTRLDRALARRDDLRDRVRLVTVSFDPARDTPEQMAELRRHLRPQSSWRFLTARSEEDLRPVLADYGQDAVPLVTAGGTRTGRVRHVTLVFLVDATGAIRNVYSTGFLDHRLLLRDAETLLGLPGDGS